LKSGGNALLQSLCLDSLAHEIMRKKRQGISVLPMAIPENRNAAFDQLLYRLDPSQDKLTPHLTKIKGLSAAVSKYRALGCDPQNSVFHGLGEFQMVFLHVGLILMTAFTLPAYFRSFIPDYMLSVINLMIPITILSMAIMVLKDFKKSFDSLKDLTFRLLLLIKFATEKSAIENYYHTNQYYFGGQTSNWKFFKIFFQSRATCIHELDDFINDKTQKSQIMQNALHPHDNGKYHFFNRISLFGPLPSNERLDICTADFFNNISHAKEWKKYPEKQLKDSYINHDVFYMAFKSNEATLANDFIKHLTENSFHAKRNTVGLTPMVIIDLTRSEEKYLNSI
jgi:hypothetical protein